MGGREKPASFQVKDGEQIHLFRLRYSAIYFRPFLHLKQYKQSKTSVCIIDYLKLKK